MALVDEIFDERGQLLPDADVRGMFDGKGFITPFVLETLRQRMALHGQPPRALTDLARLWYATEYQRITKQPARMFYEG